MFFHSSVFVFAVIALLYCIGGSGCSSGRSGEALFMKHCAVCHPNGGNIINPTKTLRKKDLAAGNIRTEDDILKIIRNPGPGMSRFDEKMLSDGDARDIARYILSVLAR
jgi:mono/diheme cytochrome c family protein